MATGFTQAFSRIGHNWITTTTSTTTAIPPPTPYVLTKTFCFIATLGGVGCNNTDYPFEGTLSMFTPSELLLSFFTFSGISYTELEYVRLNSITIESELIDISYNDILLSGEKYFYNNGTSSWEYPTPDYIINRLECDLQERDISTILELTFKFFGRAETEYVRLYVTTVTTACDCTTTTTSTSSLPTTTTPTTIS